MADALGLARGDRRLDRDLLGMRALLAAVADAEDRIAHREIRDPLAQRGDDAGIVAAQHVGEGLDLAIGAALADLPVVAVDAGGMDVDGDPARPGHGLGPAAVRHHPPTPKPPNN